MRDAVMDTGIGASMSAPPQLARRFVAWTLRRGHAIWVVALLLAVPAAARTAMLYAHLRSEVEQLLPRNAPSVLAIDELRNRMPGLQFLGVLVDTGTAKNIGAGDRLIDDLAARVRKYPPEMVRTVRTGQGLERQFLEDNAPLYLDLADLQTIRARVEARRDYEVAHEMGTSLDDDAPPSIDFKDIKARYEQRLPIGRGKLTGDRFSSAELHTTLLLIEAAHFTTGDDQKALLHRVESDLAALGGPDAYAAGMRVGYTGDVAISVEEVSALVADLSLSSVLVIVAVVAAIVIYYRWWRSVVVLVTPLLLATVYAFGLATLPPFSVTELNTNTAFLGSIIVGNGVNFGIVLLARYVEERRRAVPVEEALVTAVWGTRLGTLSAALAAGVSYAALVITDFRGFRQFGSIGGIGMVMSWLVAFVLMPPLLAWLDHSPETAPPPKPAGIVARLSPLVARFAVPITLGTVVLTAAAAWKVHGFDSSQLEYDLSKLRRADTWTSGEGYWGRRMDELLGEYLTPTVILADDREQARAIAAAARAQLQGRDFAEMVSTVRSADDVFPPDQAAKVAILRAIRKDLTPRVRASLAPDDAKEVDRFLGKPDLSPLLVQDLPTTFTEALLERDGSFGRTVLVYPRPSHGLWEGPQLVAFVAALRTLAEVPAAHDPSVRPARVAGSLPLSADIISSIQRDGFRTSLAAFLGVVFVVVVIFRGHRTTAAVLGALAIGVLYLFAAAMVLGVKINFSNFIAFPITFGIGVDYSVNVMSRYVEDGDGDPAAAVRSIGGAVALCSLTTIIGYSSLLIAENRALHLFGLMAVLGEICCLSTALVTMPALLIVARRYAGSRLRSQLPPAQ
jgi:predicted RND superfamily exporter protein